MSIKVQDYCVTIVQRKEKLCAAGVHEYCTQSRNPPTVICLNCGKVVTDFSDFTDDDYDKLETIDDRLQKENLDLYR